MGETVKRTDLSHEESYSPKKPEILRMAEALRGYPKQFILPDRSAPPAPETRHNCPAFAADFACEFSYFLEYGGMGYGFVHKDPGWRCDVNYTLANVLSGFAMRPACLPVTTEGLQRLYRAAGFPSRITYRAGRIAPDARRPAVAGEPLSEAEMKDMIKHALCDLGQPVIVDPIESCFAGAAVVGYREDGDTLLAYWYPPYFMAPDNVAPQIVEVNNWYREDTQLSIMGERKNALPVETLYREGLIQIRDALHAGVHGEARMYYDEWENFLRQDLTEMTKEVQKTGIIPGARLFADDYNAASGEDGTLAYLHLLCDPVWCDIAERRYYLMHFFYQAARYFPVERQAFAALEGHFFYTSEIMGNQEHGYISEVGHDPVNAEAFAKPEVRARMADQVRRLREADAEGLKMLEELLVRLKLS